jgi:glycosyltransferase involved in cell wall biosynthesis
MVNSSFVKNDINTYYPGFTDKVFALPFAPYPDRKWLQSERVTLPYEKISQRYFIISNQFWTHKSHITAFKALKILHRNPAYADVQIICTGNQHDKRCPEYFNNLEKEIKKMGIEKETLFLGFIPKSHQILLMKSSIAVVQPTLFEGGPGGGSVYHAVALGLPAIVSDIQINREIHEPNVLFFEAGNEFDLAQKMEKVLSKTYQKPTMNQIIKKGELRLQSLSDRLNHIINISINN